MNKKSFIKFLKSINSVALSFCSSIFVPYQILDFFSVYLLWNGSMMIVLLTLINSNKMKKLLLSLGVILTFSFSAMAQTPSKVANLSSTIDATTVTDYDINMDFEIKEISVGPCFAAKDANNFFMWQINIETGRTVFRPHSWLNGGGACHADKDITDLINIQKGVVYALRIEIRGDKATTYINNILVDLDRVNPRGGNYGFANLGFREDKAMSSETLEEAYYDNVKETTTVDGAVVTLFEENFSKPLDFQFAGGDLVDGRFHGIGRTIYWQIAPSLYSVYTIKMDFEINEIAAGPCFTARDAGNFYMWQINIEGGRSYFRPHSWLNGGGACHEEKDISSLIVLQKNVTYALRIEINGEKASTYINDILIDADRINPRGGRVYGYSKLGFRASHASNSVEDAYYDNIVVSTVINGTQTTLFSENFSSSVNTFSAGQIVNERLSVVAPSIANDLYSWQNQVANITTAVKPLTSETEFSIFPNPVQNILNISATPVAYQIFNLTGRQVQAGNGTTVDVANYTSGIYMIRIGSKVTKFVKN